jgi:hypothetical protein
MYIAQQTRCRLCRSGQSEDYKEGESRVENVLRDIAAQIHAQMQPEGADAQRR